jgi:RNA 2',3'-cyclic 3'-phosphodiesterase
VPSVAGNERLRLFAALLLPADAVAALSAWQARELSDHAGLRVVPGPNLHVTVAFLGGRPAGDVERIAQALREAARHTGPVVLEPTRYRETRSVAMIVFADQDDRAKSLAERVFTGLESLRVYERERRDWLPHVTVARFRERPRLAPPVPQLGAVVSSEMAVMMSRLRRSGAQYEVLESVSLGG